MLQTRQAAGAFSAMTANAFTEDMEKSKEAGMTSICPSRWTLRCWSVLSGSTLLPPENERPSTEIYPVSP